MFCVYCGKKLADNALFCPNCGNMVKTETPAKQPEPVRQEPVQAAPVQPTVAVRQTPPVQTAPPVRPATPVQPAAAPVRSAPPVQPAAAPVRSAPPVQPAAAAAAPVYTQTAKPTDAEASRKAGIWPAVCGTMGVLALMFYLTGVAVARWIFGIGVASDSIILVISLIYALMAVVFFVHTRKIPWITIFPFLFYIIYMVYMNRYFIEEVSYYRGLSWNYLLQILSTFLPIIVFIFYVLIVLIRPEGSGLRVVFLIFMIMELIVIFASMSTSAYQMARYGDLEYMTYSFFFRIAQIFFYIGYLTAGMNVRRYRS